MIDAFVDILQTAMIVILVWNQKRQCDTMRIVARIAAGADKELEAAPDPEKARKAAEAIDKFNDGIANILNYTGEAEK